MAQDGRPQNACCHAAVGVSQTWRNTMALVRKMAPLEVPVLITGKSGAGKEVVAQTLHQLSRRSEGPFVPLNCGLLQDNLLESELFGHCKGAFTGATSNKAGLCQAAQDGTLFLDEIGELPASSQAMLLRLLETGEYRPLGSTEIRCTNARIVAATNRNLARMIAEGRFRQDLYYRLNVLSIHVPPLNTRKDDIPLLIEHFLQRGDANDLSRKLTPAAMERLRAHHWPGNVRELKNVVERMRVLCDEAEIGEEAVRFTISADSDENALQACGAYDDALPDHTTDNPTDNTRRADAPVLPIPSEPTAAFDDRVPTEAPIPTGDVQPLATMELMYVQWALVQYDGNVSDAARALGVARSTIYRILQRASA